MVQHAKKTMWLSRSYVDKTNMERSRTKEQQLEILMRILPLKYRVKINALASLTAK